MAQPVDEAKPLEFPLPRSCPFDPPVEFTGLRPEQPVRRVLLPNGRQAWLLTRYEDVRCALTDPRLSADTRQPGFPSLRKEAVRSPLEGTFMRQDGEPHFRVRRMLAREFTLKRAEAMRPGIEAAADILLDRMAEAGPPADLVQAYGLPLPSMVICMLLGVPPEDQQAFQQRSRTMLDTKASQDEVREATMGMLGYLDQLVERKRQEPVQDLISRLVAEQLEPGHVERRELVMILMILLVGGHDTTASNLTLSVLALLQHPEQLAALRSDPGLVPGAVEELLRYLTVAQVGTFRAVTEELEIGGRRLRPGEGVIALLPVANRDPETFSDPDRLDVRRRTEGHVAFSYGPHHCLAQSLARVELQVALTRLLGRFPDLRLAVPFEEVRLRPHTMGLAGAESMPVTWEG